MVARDDLLRAAVYAAIDAYEPIGPCGVPPAYRAACERVIFVHRTWPLIEYAHAIETAAELARDDEELLEWYASIGVVDRALELARIREAA